VKSRFPLLAAMLAVALLAIVLADGTWPHP
jgi:hypothetical protein